LPVALALGLNPFQKRVVFVARPAQAAILSFPLGMLAKFQRVSEYRVIP